jgi:hypothetical protein
MTPPPTAKAGIISAADEGALREFLYAKAVAMGLGGGGSSGGGDGGADYSMLYAGMESGLFTGYFSPTEYTLRAPSGAPEDVPWAPFALEATCGDGNDASGAVCDVNDAGDACKITTGACSFAGEVNEICAVSDACSGVAGKTVQRSGTCPADDDACVDSNVRNYYATSEAEGGGPTTFTRWRQYEPRERPWFTTGKARWADSQQKLSFSTVYEFSTSGELGITATGTLIQNDVFLGLYALDYDLVKISELLTQVATAEGSWAYAIERSGPDAGMLVASTVDDSLRVRPGKRLQANASAHSSVQGSAYLLQPKGWPEGYYRRFDGLGFATRYHKCYLKLGYESCAAALEDQYVPWAAKDPSDNRAAGPAACESATCVDDDACLQANPAWGASYTCAGSTQYCSSYRADMACCPESCGMCSEDGVLAADASSSGAAAASGWGRRVQSSSSACIKPNADFGGDVDGCGYAPMIKIAVDSANWDPPGWFTGPVNVHPDMSSPEDCQALCQEFVDSDGKACEFFSYEWEAFTSFEIITGSFTGDRDELDW